VTVIREVISPAGLVVVLGAGTRVAVAVVTVEVVVLYIVMVVEVVADHSLQDYCLTLWLVGTCNRTGLFRSNGLILRATTMMKMIQPSCKCKRAMLSAKTDPNQRHALQVWQPRPQNGLNLLCLAGDCKK
jgi:hypothetical protein